MPLIPPLFFEPILNNYKSKGFNQGPAVCFFLYVCVRVYQPGALHQRESEYHRRAAMATSEARVARRYGNYQETFERTRMSTVSSTAAAALRVGACKDRAICLSVTRSLCERWRVVDALSAKIT